MSVLCLFSVLLSLLSLSVAAPTPDECSQLIKPITLEDRPKIFGEWIQIEVFTGNEVLGQRMKQYNSLWQRLSPVDDQTVGLSMQARIEGRCYGSTPDNYTFIDDSTLARGAVSYSILKTCPDCLLINYNYETTGLQGLFIYGRTTSLSESDLETVRKQAECLLYPLPAVFHYNGVTDLCPE